jgi:hypothetical protein
MLHEHSVDAASKEQVFEAIDRLIERRTGVSGARVRVRRSLWRSHAKRCERRWDPISIITGAVAGRIGRLPDQSGPVGAASGRNEIRFVATAQLPGPSGKCPAQPSRYWTQPEPALRWQPLRKPFPRSGKSSKRAHRPAVRLKARNVHEILDHSLNVANLHAVQSRYVTSSIL